MEKEDGEEDFQASAFEALEKDFQEVLQELIGDKSLEHFRLEYEKLHRALKKSHESEKRLIKKCKELNSEIVSNATKVQTALNLSKDDQMTIQNLKKEIERAWKMVEASHEKEQRAKETIHNLKAEITNLNSLVEQGAGLSVNQENTVNSLITQRDDLLRTRDKLESQVQKMTNDNISLTETVQKHESEKLQGEVEITNLRDMLNAKRTEAERELRRRERLEKELQELKQSLESRSKNLRAIQNGIKEQEDLKDVHDKALKEQRFLVEQLNEKEEKILEEIEKLKRDTRNEEERRKKLHEENLELGKEYKAKAEEMKACQQEKDKAQKAFDQLKRKKALEDDERHEIEMSRGVLRSDTENLIREIDQLKKQVEVDSKAVAEIMRERETLYRSVLRTAGRTTSQSELVKNHDARTQSLEKDVTRVKEDLQNAIKRVYELDKTREKYGIELSLANSKHMAALEELKNRDNKISELKKNHADVKGKLAQQKQAYEAVRTERNLFSKNLVESQDEIAEMKRKFKIMYHQIEQLKEEIKEKDQALIKEHWDHTRMHKQCENIKDQMEKAKKKQQHLQGQKETQLSEIKKLESRLQEAEVERNSQKRKYEEIISERDILGTQLIRRNDELALLYEKIKIQQRTLQGGEIAYKQRLEESRALAIRTAALKRELLIAGRKVSDIDEIKREVFQLQRELLRERTKVKALSEELENPLNVHRWRKLEGTDPAMYETMQKVKTLQKRLISKTEEAVEKDLAIQEKEKLYLEMRNLLQKQPGPEIVEEVAKQQQSLKEKTKGMKAMAAELNMYHAQLNDYKDEIERLTKELQDTKRRYFEQRRREQLLQDTSRTEKDRAARTQETQAAQSRG
jgi:chromosome segregation ATPase|mmetsp:Transcript_66473/g.105116  ORF Transcript_66473/g.105116 Transcript_66473/m.105116 type:complete len:860 (-) Transcript_66473:77-2656(-)